MASKCANAFYDYYRDSYVETVEEYSEYIFLGYVKSKRSEIYEDIYSEGKIYKKLLKGVVEIDVIDGIKGDVKGSVYVALEDENCSCIYDFKVGRKYLIYASGSKEDKAVLNIYYCSFIKEVE